MALSKHFKRSNFSQKFFELHAWVKKCHFGNFSEKGWNGRAPLVRPSKRHFSIWKIIFVLGAHKYLERLESKLESAYSFMLKYSNITVWPQTLKYTGRVCQKYALLQIHQLYKYVRYVILWFTSVALWQKLLTFAVAFSVL